MEFWNLIENTSSWKLYLAIFRWDDIYIHKNIYTLCKNYAKFHTNSNFTGQHSGLFSAKSSTFSPLAKHTTSNSSRGYQRGSTSCYLCLHFLFYYRRYGRKQVPLCRVLLSLLFFCNITSHLSNTFPPLLEGVRRLFSSMVGVVARG